MNKQKNKAPPKRTRIKNKNLENIQKYKYILKEKNKYNQFRIKNNKFYRNL